MKNKLILSLGTSLLVFTPVITVVSCGNDAPASTPQTELNNFVNGLTFTAPTNKQIVQLNELVTTTDQNFNAAAITTLGLTGTLPTIPEGVTLKYSFVKSTVVESKQTYTLTIKGSKETLTEATKAITVNSSDLLINISNMTPQQFVEAIDSHLNARMFVNARYLTKKIGSGLDAKWVMDFPKLRQYTDAITMDKVITVTDGTTLHTLDFSAVAAEVAKIKRLADNESLIPEANLIAGATIGNTLQSGGMPQMAALLANTAGVSWSMLIAPFMSLTEMEYDSRTMTAEGGVNSPEFQEFLDQHAYINMLKEYHKVLWPMIQTDMFQDWNEGKEYVLPMHYKNIGMEDPYIISYTAKGGEYLDDQTMPIIMLEKIDNEGVLEPQISNFETLWVSHILKMDTEYMEESKVIARGKTEVQAISADWTDSFFDANGNIKTTGTGLQIKPVTPPAGWQYEEKGNEGHKGNFATDYFVFLPNGSTKLSWVFFKSITTVTNASGIANYPELLPNFNATTNLISTTNLPAGWAVTTDKTLPALATAEYVFGNGESNIFYTTETGRKEIIDIWTANINTWAPITTYAAADIPTLINATGSNAPVELTQTILDKIATSASITAKPIPTLPSGARIMVEKKAIDTNGQQGTKNLRATYGVYIEKGGFKTKSKDLVNSSAGWATDAEMNATYTNLDENKKLQTSYTTSKTTMLASEAIATITSTTSSSANTASNYDNDAASKLGITLPDLSGLKFKNVLDLAWHIYTYANNGVVTGVTVDDTAGTIELSIKLMAKSELGNHYWATVGSTLPSSNASLTRVTISGFRTTTA